MEAVVEHRLRSAHRGMAAGDGGVRGPDVSRVSGRYPTGMPIQVTCSSNTAPIAVFHAGTKRDAGQVVTAGGRVLAVTAWAPSLLRREQKCIRRCRRFRSRSALSDRYRASSAAAQFLIRHRDQAITWHWFSRLPIHPVTPHAGGAACAGCTWRRRTSHRDILWSGRPSDRRSGPTPPGRSEGGVRPINPFWC